MIYSKCNKNKVLNVKKKKKNYEIYIYIYIHILHAYDLIINVFAQLILYNYRFVYILNGKADDKKKKKKNKVNTRHWMHVQIEEIEIKFNGRLNKT
jgi:hypothetical protein